MSPAAVVAAVALLLAAVVGARLAVGILRSPVARPPAVALADPGASDLGLGQPVRTSFGSMVVSAAETNDGLSTEDLGGMSHGVSQLVSKGSAQVSVVVTLANTGQQAVETAADQFRLLTGRHDAPVGAPALPQTTSMHAGRLAPGAAVEARVTFVTPTNGSLLWLQYTDPAGGRPIRISLGSTSRVVSPPSPVHH